MLRVDWREGQRRRAWEFRELIRRAFGVTYDPSHISRLLHRLGYSVQRPSNVP